MRCFAGFAIFAALLMLGETETLAHNMFVRTEAVEEGPDRVEVIFEHAPRAGKGGYYDPILARGKTFVRTLDDSARHEVRLERVEKDGIEMLRGTTNVGTPRAVEHTCLWGVYHGRLDYFHGKRLDVATMQEADKLGRSEVIPLDLVPLEAGEKLRVQVLWQGEPHQDAAIFAWTPKGKELKTRPDERGVVEIDVQEPGTYAVSAIATFDGERGRFEEKPYDGLMHGTTLALPCPLQ